MVDSQYDSVDVDDLARCDLADVDDDEVDRAVVDRRVLSSSLPAQGSRTPDPALMNKSSEQNRMSRPDRFGR